MNVDHPFLTLALLNDQPAGSGFRQGTSEAEGTDWACSQSGYGWQQSILAICSGVVVTSLLTSTK